MLNASAAGCLALGSSCALAHAIIFVVSVIYTTVAAKQLQQQYVG